MKRLFLLYLLLIVAGCKQAEPTPVAESDRYTGSFRAAAKTTPVDGPAIELASVQRYIDTVVTPLDDSSIRTAYPEVTDSHADRIAPERRVVRLHAFLTAVRKEDDGDYHCILSDTATSGPNIIAEASGLPTESAGQLLAEARKSVETIVGPAGMDVAQEKYQILSPPVPVVVTGSLFYDSEHKPNTIGPAGHKAVTMWEIHPIHSIEPDR